MVRNSAARVRMHGVHRLVIVARARIAPQRHRLCTTNLQRVMRRIASCVCPQHRGTRSGDAELRAAVSSTPCIGQGIAGLTFLSAFSLEMNTIIATWLPRRR